MPEIISKSGHPRDKRFSKTTIRDEIQRETRIHKIGSITYSGVGIVGGGLSIAGIATAPFTLGVSLALTVAGGTTGVASGVAGITYGIVKIGILRKLIKIAQKNLEKHKQTCKEMAKLRKLLKEDIETIKKEIKNCHKSRISLLKEGVKQSARFVSLACLVQNFRAVDVFRITGSADDVAKVMSLGAGLDDIVPSALKDVCNGVTKLSAGTLDVLAAIGVVIDIGSLVWNAIELAEIEKGKLCDETEKLQKIIKEMK